MGFPYFMMNSFCRPSLMSGYNFSFVNHAMVSPSIGDSINLFWNERMAYHDARNSMFLTPSFDASICFRYPELGAYGSNLLNPMLAMQQCMQNWQNNGMDFSKMFGNMFQNTWWNNGNTVTSGNSGLTDAQKEELAKIKDEASFLKGVLNKIKSTAEGDLEQDTLRKIKLAVEYSSSAKTELEREKEKYEKLKEAYRAIDKDIVKKVMPTMTEVQKTLFDNGFDFEDRTYTYQYEGQDDNTKEKVRGIELAIAGICNSKTACSDVADLRNGDLALRVISAWNDTHKTDDDRCIIRAINKQIIGMEVDKKKDVLTGVIQPMTEGLLEASDNIIKTGAQNFETSVKSNIDKHNDELIKALKNAINDPSTVNMSTLCECFETVYLDTRKITTMSAQKSITKKYSFIDNIDTGATDDIFTNDLFKDATIKDLKDEGFSGNALNFDDFKVKKQSGGSNEPKITKEFLMNNTEVQKLRAEENGFEYDIYKYKDKYYEIKNDGTVKEVSNPTLIEEVEPPQNTENTDENVEEVTKEILLEKGTEIKKIRVKTKNGTTKEVETNKLANGKKYYEYEEKIYSIDKNNKIKEETDVQKAE